MSVVSAIPAAIDWIVANAEQLPSLADPALVADGWSDRTDADTTLIIGITPEDPQTNSAPEWAEVGARTTWETFTIPCILWAFRGGTVMKTARDAAFGVLNELDTMLREDPTLGGALRSGTARIANVRIDQTGDADTAGGGRACEIRFDIACKSRSTA